MTDKWTQHDDELLQELGYGLGASVVVSRRYLRALADEVETLRSIIKQVANSVIEHSPEGIAIRGSRIFVGSQEAALRRALKEEDNQ